MDKQPALKDKQEHKDDTEVNKLAEKFKKLTTHYPDQHMLNGELRIPSLFNSSKEHLDTKLHTNNLLLTPGQLFEIRRFQFWLRKNQKLFHDTPFMIISHAMDGVSMVDDMDVPSGLLSNGKTFKYVKKIDFEKSFKGADLRLLVLENGTFVFHMNAVLGKGAGGKIYLIQDIDNGHFYSAKTGSRYQYEENETIISQITQRYILHLKEKGLGQIEKGIGFILVQKYVWGKDFYDLTQPEQSNLISFRPKLDLMLQIIQEYTHLFDVGILHRDVKLENILFDGETKRVNFIDFGLARIKNTDKGYMEQEKPYGTPGYIAPEIIIGFKKDAQTYRLYNEQSEVFSLGILFLEILTGKSINDYEAAFERKLINECGTLKFGKIEELMEYTTIPSKAFLSFIGEKLEKYVLKKTNEEQFLVNLIKKMIDILPEKRPGLKDIEESLKINIKALKERRTESNIFASFLKLFNSRYQPPTTTESPSEKSTVNNAFKSTL